MFKTNSDMINLLGCKKENFYKLLELMHYKIKKTGENKEEFFSYQPQKNRITTKKIRKKVNENSPFEKLSGLRFR